MSPQVSHKKCLAPRIQKRRAKNGRDRANGPAPKTPTPCRRRGVFSVEQEGWNVGGPYNCATHNLDLREFFKGMKKDKLKKLKGRSRPANQNQECKDLGSEFTSGLNFEAQDTLEPERITQRTRSGPQIYETVAKPAFDTLDQCLSIPKRPWLFEPFLRSDGGDISVRDVDRSKKKTIDTFRRSKRVKRINGC